MTKYANKQGSSWSEQDRMEFQTLKEKKTRASLSEKERIRYAELKDKKTKYHRKTVMLIIFFAVCVAGLVLVLINQSSEKSTVHITAVSSYKEPSFSTFVVGWNDKVRAFDLEDGHLLSSTDNKLMIRKFKAYINYFANPLPKNIEDELANISQVYPRSIWAMYQDFIKSYVGKYHGQLDWSSIDSNEKLDGIMLDVTKARSGSPDIDESIKLLLAASDPCAYFGIYKTEIWKRGLSKNFRTCDANIINQETKKYHALAALIK